MAAGLSESEPAVLILDEIEEGITRIDIVVPLEALDMEDERFSFPQAVSCAASVVRSLETYNVKGRIICQLSGDCCRCLAPAKALVQADMQVLIQRREAAKEELEAVEDQEMEIVDPGAKQMDLKGRIRDELILELPHQLYCKEDCKGLCPTCGQDFNLRSCSCSGEAIDPRWAALGNIRF